VLRPISPLAWIPIAILWFGVGDLAAIFLIFLATLLPLTRDGGDGARCRTSSRAHRTRPATSARPGLELVRQRVLPGGLPQLILGMRLALGIAWLVVVAAEMIAVNSGLGFLIIDARNAGNALRSRGRGHGDDRRLIGLMPRLCWCAGWSGCPRCAGGRVSDQRRASSPDPRGPLA
jgi:ABC-type nitrate/sulfonate/bicarbonate transport system permease component